MIKKIAIALILALFLSGVTYSKEPYVYAPLNIPMASVFILPDFSNRKIASPPKETAMPVWNFDQEVSWYGPGFYGHRTACGQAYTTAILGVAHRSLPCGTLVAFMWEGKSITVPVIDRGPYVKGRIWDLSGALCTYLDHCYTGPIYYQIIK